MPTRIAGTAFRLLQHNEKNSFRIKETCMRRLRTHRSTVRRAATDASLRACARDRTAGATRQRRIVEAPANWAFHPCRKIRAQAATHALTAFATMRARRCAAPSRAIFAVKKILRTSLRKAASRRIGSARRSGNRANRLSPIRKHGCSDRSGKPLDEARRRLHRIDSRLREVLGTPRKTPLRAAIGVRSGHELATVRDRASP